jgi:tetratricopeptide (TPR) repeat protein
MRRNFSRLCVALLLALLGARPLSAATAPVTVTEQQVVIPTYLIGDPDPNPQFYFGGNSQGAEHRIYPYPMYDNLTTQKVDKSYKMVYLENEFIKVGILPEIGGKIFEAIDKTNGYNFFYRQHVIKPALISLLGAWISGGVEWDIPHHHRATSFLPVQYHVDTNPDGSKTVWVGELELRDRMEWTVGITLHPGRSYLEASFRIINRTPVPTSMLCFSNVAVSVNDTYQVIFPPSTQHVTYHGKRDFTTWPIATTRFNGADFTAGVDVSWYKNHVSAMSMFAWNYRDDFLAGYDHGKHAGTMSIADHNFVPGKKFWTWGNGPNGRLEDKLLTDSDGPYIELMVGAYSDNQPDYTWLAPYEARRWTQYWYPFRDIGGAKNANTEAAVNLDVKDGKATLGFYSTANHPAATVTLRLKDKVVLFDGVAIGPGHPYNNEVTLPVGIDVHDLRAALFADGRELVAYSPVRLDPEAMPADVTPYPVPAQIKTNEELYLAGLRIEQFHAPAASPDPYWQEALKRDPGDVRVNTALGIDCIKAGRYGDAENYLRTALVRATDRYTTPKDCEPFYYLGLALRAQGKIDDAFDQFSKSTWSAQWRGPGYFEMAQIASARGDLNASLEYANNSLDANEQNIRALALKASMLIRAGRTDEAREALAAIRKINPLDVRAMAEQWLASPSPENLKPLIDTVTQFPAMGLELAAEYCNAGQWQDGTIVLMQIVEAAPDKSKLSPLLYDYLAHFSLNMNQLGQATRFFEMAAQAPTDYVFPFQMEMIPIFDEAMNAVPSDAKTPYYLGNLLYDWQPQRAVALWEKSASLHADFPVVYHNLALIYSRQGTARDKVLASLQSAAQFGGNAMVFADLDKLNEEDGVSPDKRLSMIQSHAAVINRDEIISREINLDIFAAKYDDAIKLIQSRFFRSWEGGGGGRYSLGDSWVNANVLKGRQHLAAKDYAAALADFHAAQTLPESLIEAGGNVSSRACEISYWIGVAYEAQGEPTKATQAWTDATATPPTDSANAAGRGARGGRGGPTNGLAAGAHVADTLTYYRALAFAKLGNHERASVLFQQLLDAGTRSLVGMPDVSTFANATVPADQRMRDADAHFVAGLGYLGMQNQERARQELNLALQASPDHLAAKVALGAMLDGQ